MVEYRPPGVPFGIVDCVGSLGHGMRSIACECPKGRPQALPTELPAWHRACAIFPLDQEIKRRYLVYTKVIQSNVG
jgi:hypothetical protein